MQACCKSKKKKKSMAFTNTFMQRYTQDTENESKKEVQKSISNKHIIYTSYAPAVFKGIASYSAVEGTFRLRSVNLFKKGSFSATRSTLSMIVLLASSTRIDTAPLRELGGRLFSPEAIDAWGRVHHCQKKKHKKKKTQ